MKALRRKALTIMTVMTMLSFSLVVFIPAAVAAPQTFTVNSVADDSDANAGDGVCETATPDECTYRAAIEEANANEGADTIEFNIPGDPSTVHQIEPQTALPGFTDEVHVNGYTQPGASENTTVSPDPMDGVIKIELVGQNPTDMSAGAFFAAGSENSSLRGLSIYDFGKYHANPNEAPTAVNVYALATDITIAGNYIGVQADGLTTGEGNNSTGVAISGGALRTQVGGSNPQDRNIIHNESNVNAAAGIFGGSEGVEVYGNYLGIGKDGVTDFTPGDHGASGFDFPLAVGANLVTSTQVQGNIGNTIGGSGVGQANLFAGLDIGIVLSSVGNVIQGNYIGTDHTGNVNDSITNGMGINATVGAYNLIGGTDPGEGNTIAGILGAGISISTMYVEDMDFELVPVYNSILGNSIHDITVFEFEAFGDMNQGIDLFHMIDNSPSDFIPDEIEQRGPNANDAGDIDDGANNLINYPVLKTAVQTGSNLEVVFDLEATGSSNGDYRVEFFANDESTIFGYGPGQQYLGSTTVQNGEDLVAILDVGLGDFSYKSLSATVTEVFDQTPWGFGNTSEFSENVQIGSASDFDADGISDAMEDAAANDGDGNNDGIDDRLQPTVSSYTIGATPVTFVTDGCSANGYVSSLSVDSLDSSDAGFIYPYGLTDFSLNCSRGDTVSVTKYVHDNSDDDISDFHVRKYLPDTDEYIEVEEATIERQVIGGNNTLVMSYSITDGGQYDDDGEANGVIVDPVGLAQVFTSSSTTDDTGQTGNNPGAGSGASGDGSTDSQVNSATGSLVNTGANSVHLQVIFAIILLAAGVTILSLTGLPKLALIRRRKN